MHVGSAFMHHHSFQNVMESAMDRRTPSTVGAYRRRVWYANLIRIIVLGLMIRNYLARKRLRNDKSLKLIKRDWNVNSMVFLNKMFEVGWAKVFVVKTIEKGRQKVEKTVGMVM